MPDKLQVSIIGLGLIGASAGLALRRHSDRVTVVGHDPNPSVASAAKKAGAVDRTDWNVIGAISGADRVLLALPFDQVVDTLKVMGQDLKQGCVIVDTADIKVSALAAAVELLPAGVHFVGGHPILVPENMDPDKATADLFTNKLFCLTPDSRTDSAAVHLAADLVEALGATAFFLDPLEHDGMAAAVTHLPQLLAAALLDVTSRSASWKDMRKVAGAQFYTSTLITEGNGRSVAAGLAANREQVMRWLDELTVRLDEWRQALADGKDEAVVAAIDDGVTARERWIEASILGRWNEEQTSPPMPSSGGMFRDMFGFGKWRIPPPGQKRK
jgi:prephenate dehydrogenase